LGIEVRAKNGGTRSLSYLYWGWVRHIASEEGSALPQSGSAEDSLSEPQAKKLASALGRRAGKIRNGTAPRDASKYVQQIDKTLLPQVEGQDVTALGADFDDPDSMDEIAKFFDSSGGVTLEY
jgi:hypothetical protein